MIENSLYVAIQKVGGDHIKICKVARKQEILIQKLRFRFDDAIGQPYGLFEVRFLFEFIFQYFFIV